ncbi:unnamed protein product [Mytilus coruscus]|uniref:Uncharacterized protein n=1 Tax=Mytilus coruscus TaxID=42192 RepID=A0A6J8EB59_MYTCO|nr:unnamed protein product [Mytilus coruscus]
MGTGFFIFTFLFSVIFLLQIVGFFSPNWDIQCVENSDLNITTSENQTCFYQGLFYGCEDSGKCRLTNLIDSKVFGLSLGIILGNIIVLFLSILVLAHVYKEYAKSMKTGAMLMFATTEIMNIASTLFFWRLTNTIGWSCWVFSWSAAILITIIVFTCICCFISIFGEEGSSSKRYFIYHYVVD